LNEYLIAIAITLIVIDFFIASEFPSFVAYLLLSYVTVVEVDVDPLYGVALGGLVFGVLLVFHFQVLRALSSVVIDKFISPDKIPTGDDGLVGEMGRVAEVSGKRFVRVGDQLCVFLDDAQLGHNTQVKVIGVQDTKLVVEPVGSAGGQL